MPRLPTDFFGKVVRPNWSSLGMKRLSSETDEPMVLVSRFDPESLDEAGKFHTHSAVGYELYVICTPNGVIQAINHRIEQCCMAHRSFAPSSAPTHIFPAGALFDIEWQDIAPVARRRMLKLLTQLTNSPR